MTNVIAQSFDNDHHSSLVRGLDLWIRFVPRVRGIAQDAPDSTIE
jgi:hypothetical protein